MKPILFAEAQTDFTTNGIGRLSDAISCTVTEERNGQYELHMEYPIDGHLMEEVAYSRIIYATAADNKGPQPFRIYRITKPLSGIVEIDAEHVPSSITSLIIRNQPALTDFTCPSLSGVTTLWLENVGTTVDTQAIIEALQTGARVRIFGFTWNLDDQDDISDMFDILDTMRGLDQNGDNVATAQVYGTIHVPSITGDVIAHANARYPDVTITYDHVSATIRYLDNDGTVLGTETILDGAAPAHTPVLTTKEDNRYYYTFLGWGRNAGGSVDQDIFSDTTGDITTYAIYSLVEKTFTVRFYNGTVLMDTYTSVAYGANVNYETEPSYNGIGNPGDYVFTGWSPMPENITADTDCYAQYQFVGTYFRQYLTDTLVAYNDTMGLTAIGDYAFAGLTNLRSVSMPSLLSLPNSMFKGATSLETVNFPAALATNSEVFTQSTVMEVLTLPEVSILNSTNLVNSMSALKELRLPKNTSSLATAIVMCNALELLDIGVTGTVGQVLSGSYFRNLTYIIARNTSAVATPAGSTIFNASSPIGKGTGKILVPRAMVESYKADSSWGRYSAVIEAIEDNPDICG